MCHSAYPWARRCRCVWWEASRWGARMSTEAFYKKQTHTEHPQTNKRTTKQTHTHTHTLHPYIRTHPTAPWPRAGSCQLEGPQQAVSGNHGRERGAQYLEKNRTQRRCLRTPPACLRSSRLPASVGDTALHRWRGQVIGNGEGRGTGEHGRACAHTYTPHTGTPAKKQNNPLRSE